MYELAWRHSSAPDRSLSPAASACWMAESMSPRSSNHSARARVKLGLVLRVEPAQLGAQHLAEQRVVAILRASAVQAHEQDIGAREFPQHPG